jgi:hypothetical protein
MKMKDEKMMGYAKGGMGAMNKDKAGMGVPKYAKGGMSKANKGGAGMSTANYAKGGMAKCGASNPASGKTSKK